MKQISRILCAVLMAVMLLTVFGCTPPEGSSSSTTTAPSAPAKLEISMSLSGVWVTADGEVQSHLERVPFTVSGWLPAEFESYSYVGEIEMDFQWPKSFDYQNMGKQTYYAFANMTDRHDFRHAIYHVKGWSWNQKNTDLISLSISICPESHFVVVRVGDRYLVASTDPNADPAEIFAIYDTYVG